MPPASSHQGLQHPLQVQAAGRRHELTVTCGLALGPATALGLGRFAYALLLPSMRRDLHWSFATAGAMNSANAVGYLAGSLVASMVARRCGARRGFVGGLGVTVVALLATAGTGDTAALVALRALSGVSGAITFITGASIVAEAVSASASRRAATLLGVYFAGGGAGIVASGITIPALLSATGAASGWRWGWVLIAAIGVVALAVALPAALTSREPLTPPVVDRRWPVGQLIPLLVCYGLFGAGYIAYMTFNVAFLQRGGAGAREITTFWVLLGASSIASVVAWAGPISRLRGGRGPAVLMCVVAAGALLPIVSRSSAAAVASALLFGGSFLSVVTAVTAVARRSLQPHHWTSAIAGLTGAFALGQCLGPVLSGVLSDSPAGLSAGMSVSVALLLAGSFVALAQRHRETPRPEPAMIESSSTV